MTLWAVKFDETKRVYKEILNLPVAEESENFIMFDTKTYRLGLHRLSKKSPALNRDTVELHLEASDVDEVYKSLRSKGVKFHDAPANRPWGTRMAAFRDPEGYTVEIVGPLKEGEPTKGDKLAHLPARDE